MAACKQTPKSVVSCKLAAACTNMVVISLKYSIEQKKKRQNNKILNLTKAKK